jgi:hypothetical protein
VKFKKLRNWKRGVFGGDGSDRKYLFSCFCSFCNSMVRLAGFFVVGYFLSSLGAKVQRKRQLARS